MVSRYTSSLIYCHQSLIGIFQYQISRSTSVLVFAHMYTNVFFPIQVMLFASSVRQISHALDNLQWTANHDALSQHSMGKEGTVCLRKRLDGNQAGYHNHRPMLEAGGTSFHGSCRAIKVNVPATTLAVHGQPAQYLKAFELDMYEKKDTKWHGYKQGWEKADTSPPPTSSIMVCLYVVCASVIKKHVVHSHKEVLRP